MRYHKSIERVVSSWQVAFSFLCSVSAMAAVAQVEEKNQHSFRPFHIAVVGEEKKGNTTPAQGV